MEQPIDIKATREALDMSQAELAAELGVDQSTVSTWEKHGPPKRGLVLEALERRLKTLLKRERAA